MTLHRNTQPQEVVVMIQRARRSDTHLRRTDTKISQAEHDAYHPDVVVVFQSKAWMQWMDRPTARSELTFVRAFNSDRGKMLRILDRGHSGHSAPHGHRNDFCESVAFTNFAIKAIYAMRNNLCNAEQYSYCSALHTLLLWQSW